MVSQIDAIFPLGTPECGPGDGAIIPHPHSHKRIGIGLNRVGNVFNQNVRSECLNRQRASQGRLGKGSRVFASSLPLPLLDIKSISGDVSIAKKGMVTACSS